MAGLPQELAEAFSGHLHEGRVNLKDLLPSELETLVRHLGESPFRARQLVRWLYVRRVGSFEEMTEYLKAQKMAVQYLPERLEIIPDLPRTPSGKIQKFKLREAAKAFTGAQHP